MVFMKNQRGNVLIYILIAVVLFAALGFTLSRSMRGDSDAGALSDDRADMLAQELINYASQAGSVVQQMTTMGGTEPGNLIFLKPSDAGFNTPPNINKVFHPAGGGLNVYNVTSDALFNPTELTMRRAWHMKANTNVEWTPSAANDVLLTFIDLNPKLCAAINKRLTGSATIPTTTINYSTVFETPGTENFTATLCPDCVGKTKLCVVNTVPRYAYYNILISR